MKRNNLFLIGLAFVAVLFTSCKEDAPKAVPGFTADINEKTVTFTNTSTNASEYSWDFGDESALSTEENPVHTYDAYGDYDVRLTAGGVTSKQTISVTKVWPEIVIDGDFSDWDAVESFYVGGETSGNLMEAKITSEASTSKLYVYIKGDLSVTNHVLQVLIDADGDASTGWDIQDRYTACGVEYQYEYYIQPGPAWGGLYGWDSDEALQDWPWVTDLTTDPVAGMIFETSGVVNDAEIEFTIELTQMVAPPTSNQQIGVYFWAQNTDWAQSGQLPPLTTEDAPQAVKMFQFQ